MINITIERETASWSINGKVYDIENAKLTFKGHALYDERGKDIVCASISTILQLMYVFLDEYKYEISDYKEVFDYMESKDISSISYALDYTTNFFTKCVIDLLEDLQTQYPEYVKVIGLENF